MKAFIFFGCAAAYLCLAGASCWATEQSLHLLLPGDWPEVLVWGVTIAFFAVASLGTAYVVEALSSGYNHVENRKLKLWGGLLLTLFFWLLMSMPTNTHTFFYRDQVAPVVTKDIEVTQKYLEQISQKGKSESLALDSAGKVVYDSVMTEQRHLVAQYNGDEPPYRRGNGVVIGQHLERINKLLNVNIRHTGEYNSQDPAILNGYKAAIDRALREALRTHSATPEMAASADSISSRLAAIRDSIQNAVATKTLTDDEMKQCESEIGRGYDFIANHRDFVSFDEKTDDRAVYTRDPRQTRTARLCSVVDVFFVDFLGGKYPGSFWYYIGIALLIDIAAFIFFDIAYSRWRSSRYMD